MYIISLNDQWSWLSPQNILAVWKLLTPPFLQLETEKTSSEVSSQTTYPGLLTSLPKPRPNYDNTPEAFSALTTWLPTYLCVSPSKAKNFLKARTNAYACFYPKHLAECLVLVSISYISDVNPTENGGYRVVIQSYIITKGIRRLALMLPLLHHGTLSSPIYVYFLRFQVTLIPHSFSLFYHEHHCKPSKPLLGI